MLSIVFSLLYFLIPIQKIATQFLSLYKIPSAYLAAHTFVHDSVEYIFYEYHVTWDEARMMCLSYKAELATVDSDRRARAAIRAIADSDLRISKNLWIGAREDSVGSWYWISNGNKIILKTSSYRNLSLWYPHSADEDLQCLSLGRVHHDAPIFVPLRCNQQRSFICQKDKSKSNDDSVKIIGSTRINEEEFILYSTRLTWPDAVTHCRKQDLQIAEVKTMAQAESLALLMIRARPESIENAWIGGYSTGNTWKWLSSGSSITNNGLWRDDNKELYGCLLLDVCEIPVFLKTKCDRKRDVLCQKPLKKQINEKPTPVYVEECLYWIGFYALNWFQARTSCNELNASLVILDSSRIISHMMFLMEDNQEELRHIWTDGRRKILQMTFSNTTLRKWAWESTDEPVPEIEASFVSRCSGGQCHDNDANCLNLDRTSYDTPIIYGLACNQSQTYICQPWSGPCVTRKSDLNANYGNDDDMPQTFLSLGTTIVPYYGEKINRKSFYTSTPININQNFSSKPKSQSNKFQKEINFKEGVSSIGANFSGRNNDYNTKKGFEKNAHGEYKLKSSFSNNISSLSNDTIFNRSVLRYLPVGIFDARSKSYDKIKVYPLILRPLVYFLPNRYYYYYPRYNPQSDRKKIFLYRNKNRNNYNIKKD